MTARARSLPHRPDLRDLSPKAIAKTLNAEGIPGPMGTAWSPSTIHGHAARGTGRLNNELYVGRRIWNRQQYGKDPDTGRRVSRPNPPAEWIVSEVPDLRIVDPALWEAGKARQAATRHALTAGMVRVRRPKYLFSGLTVCGTCGGGFILSSHDLLTCFNARFTRYVYEPAKHQAAGRRGPRPAGDAGAVL